MSRVFKQFILIVVVAINGSIAFADSVPPAYARVAVSNGIPPDVFYCVGQTESGRAHQGVRKPWPWTLNIAGSGQFFDTKAQSINALTAALNQGIRNIDIGLMQINYRVHSKRVDQAVDLLDPYTNMGVSADILNEYRGSKDLWHAVGRYHSATPALKSAYQARVAKCVVNHLDVINKRGLADQTDPNTTSAIAGHLP